MDNMILKGNELFKNCGFQYYICGGFSLELFVGKPWRSHFDLDISVFQEDKRRVVAHLMQAGWSVYKSVSQPDDYKGILLEGPEDTALEMVRTLWAIKDGYLPTPTLKTDEARTYKFNFVPGSHQTQFNFIEIVLDHKDGDNFVLNKDKGIIRELDKAILYSDGVPYMAPELVLFSKSNKIYSTHVFHKEKTPQDFKEVMPLLSEESKKWLKKAINIVYPEGTDWLAEAI